MKQENGITLMALIITIIILLILAGVSISVLWGESGILTQAKTAKEATDVAAIAEAVEFELTSVQIERLNGENALTVSEVIDRLKDKNIINDDMTFVQNPNYSFTYTGGIQDNSGETVENIEIVDDDDILKREIICPPLASGVDGVDRVAGVIDGTFSYYNEYIGNLMIKANEAPTGYKFAYWIDKKGNIYSYDEEQQLSLIEDDTFTAVYVKDEETVVPKICVNAYATNRTQDGILHFMTCIKVPQNYKDEYLEWFKVYSLGTSNASIANENDLIVDTTYSGSDLYVRTGDCHEPNGELYIWGKTNVGEETWYYRGAAVMTRKDGTTETFYSPIISINK